MILNRYEYSKISNSSLPESWRSSKSLDELSDFLQANWEQRAVFYDDDEIKSQQQFLDFKSYGSINTKKYIGTIVYKGEQLNIFPRVFSTEKSDIDADNLTHDYLFDNLIKWLEYCSRINYPFINITTDFKDIENLKELFISLYLSYVQNALDRGLYFQYVDIEEDLSSIKGKFDLKDFLTMKIPNGLSSKFKCLYSIFEFDNKINRIIKFTCKHLINETSVLNEKKIRVILNRLNDVSDVQCTPSDCDIRLDNIHWYYRYIVSMSKMFLLNKVSNYSLGTEESFCFLFPTELLFEGFVGGYIKEIIENCGGKVYLQESRMNLVEKIIYKGNTSGAAFKMRHDILVEYNQKLYVLDTKYKEISRFEGNSEYQYTITNEANQADLYQVLEYARKRGIQDVYLLYPMYRLEDKESEFPIAVSESPSGSINIHFIRIPFVFENDEANTKKQLEDVVYSIFDISNLSIDD